MKTLLLLRHAKSAWDDGALPDRARPLAPRGQIAATRLGQHLHESGLVPDHISCSPARRAAETMARVLAEIERQPTISEYPELYLRGWRSLLTVAQALPAQAECGMLVSHNPDIQDFTMTMAATGTPDALAALAQKYPTGALAILTFRIRDWRELAPQTGTLVDLITPRRLA